MCADARSVAGRDVELESEYAIAGNLRTKRFDISQQCQTENIDFEETGAGNCLYH